jgi:long-subunit acyl-CoA synthetase (AMP-forming)
VREAVVLGHGRPFLSAIVCIDAEIVGRYAESRLLTYTTYQDLAAKPEIAELIRSEIARINATLPENTRISRFALLFKNSTPMTGNLTRTRKVRRGAWRSGTDRWSRRFSPMPRGSTCGRASAFRTAGSGRCAGSSTL